MAKKHDVNVLSGRAMWLILTATILVVVTFMVSEPIPQDPAYHAFVDTRLLLHIPNCLNVMSNLPFLLFGAWGLGYVHQHGSEVCMPKLRAAYVVFFVGVMLTAPGSAYYHLVPGNGTLVWDRLPMTIAFAGMFSIIIGEYMSVRAARTLLLPLLVVGASSVVYWAVTETYGSGDLRPYAVVQFLPMLLIPIILMMYRSRFDSSRYFWLMIGFYLIAKVFEHFDAAVYGAGSWVSGHTLKHISASLTPAVLLYVLMLRNSETRELTADN